MVIVLQNYDNIIGLENKDKTIHVTNSQLKVQLEPNIMAIIRGQSTSTEMNLKRIEKCRADKEKDHICIQE